MEDKYTELNEKLARLQWLLQRQHIMNHAVHGPFADTTRGQGRVLAMLKIQPEISTKDLSYLLGIKVASLNELLNKLEKGGYIVRKPSQADKRVMIIHLTEKGKTEQQADTDHLGIFDCLNEIEQQAFGEYLDRVIAALEAQVGVEPDDDELENWKCAARSRMGTEQFEHMLSMHGGFDGRGHGQRGGFHGAFRGGDPDGRGFVPGDMPGAERFDPHYDGPMPERHGFGGHPGTPPSPPSPPHAPKNPHHPDDNE